MQESHQVQNLQVTRRNDGQRIDNFLMRELKGVPRSRVYRLIRRGEVRINKKRCKPETKLVLGDIVRIPPYAGTSIKTSGPVSDSLKQHLLESIIYEDDLILVVNKPSGLAVHGGSGIKLGLIEAVRQISPQWKELELVHRLDRETSGCLLLAKTGAALRDLQSQFKEKTVSKTYHALVYGSWPANITKVSVALLREQLPSGERLVKVNEDGKPSQTSFRVIHQYPSATLIEALPETGRTHQIRVHCQYSGHPIVGDERYSSRELRRDSGELKHIKNLCLHAAKLSFQTPESGEILEVESSYGMNLKNAIASLNE